MLPHFVSDKCFPSRSPCPLHPGAQTLAPGGGQSQAGDRSHFGRYLHFNAVCSKVTHYQRLKFVQMDFAMSNRPPQ